MLTVMSSERPVTSPADTRYGSAPVVAGMVSAIVGFTSSFAVLLTGLTAVGASTQQAAAGLFWTSLLMGAGCVLFSWRRRQPITMAWSTPGAALLAGAAAPQLGWAGAVFAFAVAGLLIAATGLIGPLGSLVAKIPAPIANAMLAGVLLTLCVAPARAFMESPAVIAPVAITWLLMQRFSPRWAVPAALAMAVLVSIASGSFHDLRLPLLPEFSWQMPRLDVAAVLSLALPLYLVTMTSQNITGLAVMNSFGYRVKPRGPLLYTGLATTVAAPLGVCMLNLSAIAAALAAGPEAHPDPRKRWVAGVSTGVTYLAMGLFAPLIAALAVRTPAGILESIAGLALLASFGGAVAGALGAGIQGGDHASPDAHTRTAAILTLVVAASGIHFFGIGAALWSLMAGIAYLAVLRMPRRHGKAA
ncbi:benzoate/H(+) symporter BenE family transporter [Micrococcales bacterium 31B]|nr:benzoate/H(+) symporter BenE family transporter [Micrococcales bacterium 31B]